MTKKFKIGQLVKTVDGLAYGPRSGIRNDIENRL